MSGSALMLRERGEEQGAGGGSRPERGSRVLYHRWRAEADEKRGECFPVRGVSLFPGEGSFAPCESRLVVMCASPLHQPS